MPLNLSNNHILLRSLVTSVYQPPSPHHTPSDGTLYVHMYRLSRIILFICLLTYVHVQCTLSTRWLSTSSRRLQSAIFATVVVWPCCSWLISSVSICHVTIINYWYRWRDSYIHLHVHVLVIYNNCALDFMLISCIDRCTKQWASTYSVVVVINFSHPHLLIIIIGGEFLPVASAQWWHQPWLNP